jgi:hypothetical protein
VQVNGVVLGNVVASDDLLLDWVHKVTGLIMVVNRQLVVYLEEMQ